MRSSLRGLGGAVGFNYIIYAAPYCKRHGYPNDYLIDRNAAFYKHGVKEQHKRYAQAQAVFSSAAAEQAFLRAQQAVLARQKAEHNETQMKTTLNIVMLDKQSMYWGHVGDSRTYYAENGVLKRRTLDHSVTQMLSAIGQVEERDIRFHEDRSRLLRVLGTPWEKPQAEMEQPVALRGNMQILLCTDGFWEYITEEQIQICLEESDNAQIWMENMLELISRNDQHSERDNRTAITIWIDDGEGDITQ